MAGVFQVNSQAVQRTAKSSLIGEGIDRSGLELNRPFVQEVGQLRELSTAVVDPERLQRIRLRARCRVAFSLLSLGCWPFRALARRPLRR
jgi:hypothetical protein